MGQRKHLTFGSILLLIIAMMPKSSSQLSTPLANTVLKMHLLMTDAEDCHNKLKGIGSFDSTGSNELNLGLTENCSNCQTLNLEEYLIRLHRIAKMFEQPIIEVYKFQIAKGRSEISQCVEDIQRTVLTLKILAWCQVSHNKLANHPSSDVASLKLKVKQYLKKLPAYSSGQVSDDDVMKEFSVALIRDIFETAVVIQKDRIAIQTLGSGH